MIIKSSIAIILFLVSYGGFLIYETPSAWVIPRVNPQLAAAHARLSDPRGSIWTGSGVLQINGISLGRLTWNIGWWPLITGHVRAQLRLQGQNIQVHALIDASRTVLLVTRLKGRADLPLLARLTNLPQEAKGTLVANLSKIRLSPRGRIQVAQGTVDIHGTRLPNLGVDLGTLHLLLSGNGSKNIIHGVITNSGGDLDISGQINLYNGVRYTFITQLKPHPGSRNNSMRDALAAILGTPNAQGRYRYTTSGRLTP